MSAFEDFVTESLGNGGQPVKLIGIDGLARGISDFLGAGGGGGLQEALKEFLKFLAGNADLLKELFKTFVKILDQVIKGVGDAITDASDKLGDAFQDLLDKFLRELGEVLKAVDLTKLPASLGKGPMDALGSLKELGDLLGQLSRRDRIIARIEAVNTSLVQLAATLGGEAGELGHSLFGEVIGQTTDIAKKAVEGGEPKDLIQAVLTGVLMPNDRVVKKLFKALKSRSLWFWSGFPGGLPGGELNRWINDEETFKDHDGNLVNVGLQRQFRARLAGEVDAYLRRKLDDPNLPTLLTRADERESASMVAEALYLFFDTVIQFVLEPDCFPLDDIELDGFEDVGLKLGRLVAGQIRVSIRVTFGLLLRGVWDFTVLNKVLIEMIGSLIGGIFSAFIEAVIRNLTWTMRVISCYPAAPIGSLDEAMRWQSLETVANTGRPTDRLEYVALVRHPVNGVDVTIDPNSLIGRLIKDLGAYLDLSYQQFRIGSRFARVATVDEITITRADLVGRRLSLRATTSATRELPQPVLRAYFCCHVVVMKPGPHPTDPYFLEFDIDEVPRCVDVQVLSNRGGLARRQVFVP